MGVTVSVAGMGGWSDGVWKWGDLGISMGVLEGSPLLDSFLELREGLDLFGGLAESKDMVF